VARRKLRKIVERIKLDQVMALTSKVEGWTLLPVK
jgi:hypothetical protein